MKNLKYLLFASWLFSSPTVVFADNVVGIHKTIVFPLLAPRLSSQYGNRKHPIVKAIRHHSGVDLAAPEKSHVRSISDGVVIFSGTLPGYGNVVTIKHDREFISLYGHLSTIDAAIGDLVNAGTVIGRVGSTGRATGPHLHFEWRKSGKPLNPLKYFPELAADSSG